jgi:hypothetical protein
MERSLSNKSRFAWKLFFCFFLTLLVASFLAHEYLLKSLAESLVFSGPVEESDVIIIENLDENYLLFERAARLQNAGYGSSIIVPLEIENGTDELDIVSRKTTEMMCQIAQISNPEIVPVRHKEPISIDVARQLVPILKAKKVNSVLVVASALRSRRTYLIYSSLLSPLEIRVFCSPVYGGARPDDWTQTWHSVEEVIEQFLKLQYYRWVVL